RIDQSSHESETEEIVLWETDKPVICSAFDEPNRSNSPATSITSSVRRAVPLTISSSSHRSACIIRASAAARSDVKGSACDNGLKFFPRTRLTNASLPTQYS